MSTLPELHRRVCDIEYALGGIVNNEEVDLEYSVRSLTGLMTQVQDKLKELGKGEFTSARMKKKSATRMCRTATTTSSNGAVQPTGALESSSNVRQVATTRSSSNSATTKQTSSKAPNSGVAAVMNYDNGAVYNVGDKVLFMGKTYEMTERVGAAGFTPTGSPGSWKEVTAGGARKSRKSRKSRR